MKEEYYLIKEAAAKVGVESHVLRYWEEELKMEIHRNEMGHRYYTERDIAVFSKVKQLKEKGLQLKAIRNYLEKRRGQLEQPLEVDEIPEVDEMPEVKEKENGMVPVNHTLMTNDEKLEQFQQIMNRILSNAIRENNELIGQTAGQHAADAVITQFQGMTKEQEARAEERFQKLDRTLREIQKARQEAAAANMRPVDRRRKQRLKRKGQLPGLANVEDVTEEKAQD